MNEKLFLSFVSESVKNSVYDNCKSTHPYSLPFRVSQRVIFRDVHGSETFRTVRCPVRTVRTVRTIRTSCLRLLRSTYHGSHRLTRDA